MISISNLFESEDILNEVKFFKWIPKGKEFSDSFDHKISKKYLQKKKLVKIGKRK